MELMTERWTDDKLDGLKREMDLRFDHVDSQFAQVDRRFAQVDKRFEQVDRRFDQVDGRFDALQDRLDAMYRAMLVFGGSMFAAMASIVVGLFVTQL